MTARARTKRARERARIADAIGEAVEALDAALDAACAAGLHIQLDNRERLTADKEWYYPTVRVLLSLHGNRITKRTNHTRSSVDERYWRARVSNTVEDSP